MPPACWGTRGAAGAKPAMVATGPQAEALRNYISRKYKVAYDATGPLVGTVRSAATSSSIRCCCWP